AAALRRGVVNARVVVAEAGHVVGVEEELVAVQRLEVAAEDLLREPGVQAARTVGVAAVRQQAVDQLRGGGVVDPVRGGERVPVGARHQGQRHGERQGDGGGGKGVACVHSVCSGLAWE